MNLKPLAGAALLAVGRGAAGMAQFEGTLAAFGASLAPLLAFPLVVAGFGLAQGKLEVAAGVVLLTVIVQLTPVVVSHWLAVRWKREDQWLRYATAVNWCRWVPLVGLFPVLGIVSDGAPDEASLTLSLEIVGLYALWLNWLVARHGLSLGRGRAAALVAVVTAALAVLVMGPQLLDIAINGTSPAPANGSGS